MRNASGEFKQLLRNPFNLRLATELAEAGASPHELTASHSHIQLLTKYRGGIVQTSRRTRCSIRRTAALREEADHLR
jgi:hypothetical protein